MNTIVLIPARGGSKRVPFKNMKNLAGEPLINYTIKFAKRIIKNDKIIVSSDDFQILAHSRSLGVRTIERPPELSNDLSSTGQTLKHCIKSLDDKSIDSIITLQPTNPFRSIDDLKVAMRQYANCKTISKSLCSVSPLNFKYGHISGGIYKPENYSFGQRSQDLSKKYFENGQFYITSLDLAKQSQVLNESPMACICENWYDLIDIDDPQDFELANILMNNTKGQLGFV